MPVINTSRRIPAASIVAGIAIIATGSASHAQSYSIGGDARTFAMGGAGVALSQDQRAGGRVNPASLAFETNDISPTFPSYGVRASGPADSGVAGAYLLGGMKETDAVSIAAQYGSAKSDLGLNGYASLRINQVEISGSAVGITHIDPNAQFVAWQQSTKAVTNGSLQGATADLWSAGYYALPAVATGFTVPARDSNPYKLAIGVRAKDMVGIYSHRVVQQVQVSYDSTGTPGLGIGAPLASEMNGKSELTRSGIGADLGMLMRPRSGYGLSAALVIANALKPNFTFAYNDASGKPAGQFNILQTSFTAGLGYQTRTGLTLATDIVNLGDKAAGPYSLTDGFSSGGQEARIGAEQKFFKVISLRGGYSSYAGSTYGLGLLGVDVAFGKKVPLEVIKTLNF